MNTRKLALKLLSDYESAGKYINLSLASHMADSLSDEERDFVTALLYTTVEHKLTYDYYIGALSGRSLDKIDSTTRNILRLGICQLVDMNNIPDFAAVNETVSLARNKGERAFVNAILHSVIRERDNLPLPKREKKVARYLSVRYSVDLWIVKKYIELFGEDEAEKLLSSLSDKCGMDITLNARKTSAKEYISRLSELGIAAEPSPYSPPAGKRKERIPQKKLPGFSEGEFFVQDAACAFAISALNPQKGDTVIDVCACPGGKSFCAASLMKNEGVVYSFDIHDSKLSLISSGKERLLFDIINEDVCDAREPRHELFGKIDKVICDVPCSGLGVISKKPDMRYKSEEGISDLPALQYEIIKASANYLKPGGRLLYSTCTVLPEENEAVIKRFLSENTGYHTVDFKIGDVVSQDGCFTFIPHIHKTDGFFVSLIEKDSL